MKKFLHYLRAINAENVKEWKIEMSYRFDFIRGFIEPVVYILPYVFYGIAIVGGRFSQTLHDLTGSGDIITYTVIGWVVMGFLNTACWAMGFALRKEQWFGTLETVFAAPVPRWVYIGGMAFHSTLHQGAMILIQIMAVHLIFRLFFKTSGLLPALFFIGLMVIALYGLGIFVASLALIFKQGWMIAEILHSLVSIATPIAYPLAVLPTFLQKVAKIFPTTYGITLARHFLLGERTIWGVAEGTFRLILLGFCWILFGLIVFNMIDRKVRREGTLAYY